METQAPLQKDKVRRLSWICVENRRALFVRAPETPLFFDPGCWAVVGLSDEVVLRNKMRKELTVTLLEMRKDTSFGAQAYDKPAGQMIEMYLYVARYLGKPSQTQYIQEIRWLTADPRDMELTSEAGQAFLQYIHSQGLIPDKR